MSMRRFVHAFTITFLVTVLALLFGPLALAHEGHHHDHGKSYGQGLTGEDTIAISELLAHPDKYIDKTVRVEGTVTGVCEKRGCWMSIASDKEFESLRIKVKDGEIVFPANAKGKRAIAEGTFMKIELTLEQTIRRAKHHAEEHGESFDPASITAPESFFQIAGTGAIIFD